MTNEMPTAVPADVENLTAQGWQLVDVRTDDEWAEGRIEGAVHIPLDELMGRIGEVEPKAVFVCAVGGRSAQATAYALGEGREARNLLGGMHEWVDEGRQVVRD